MSQRHTDIDTESDDSKRTPDSCELRRFVRNQYFNGKLMTARDMQAEQRYHADRLETLAQHVVGEGVVCGLETSVTGSNGDVTVTLSPGVAVDCCGRLVVVDGTDEETFENVSGAFSLYLELHRCETEKVPVPGSQDACSENCEYNRVVEDYRLVLESGEPTERKPIPDVEFPTKEELSKGDPGADPHYALSKPARTYYGQTGDEGTFRYGGCDEGGDPEVFLGHYEDVGGTWERQAVKEPRHHVYGNDMLYAGLVGHATDFGNPHDVVTSVDGVSHVEGDVELVSADGSIVSEAGAEPGTVNLELAQGIQDDVAALEEYVRDKTLKYTIQVFYEVAETYADVEGDYAQQVNQRARLIVLLARSALDAGTFREPVRFARVVLALANFEQAIHDSIQAGRENDDSIASQQSTEDYAEALERLLAVLPERLAQALQETQVSQELIQLLVAGEDAATIIEHLMDTELAQLLEEVRQSDQKGTDLNVTELAVAQDQVAEAAGWLELPEEPATTTLPGGDRERPARIIETAKDRRGGPVPTSKATLQVSKNRVQTGGSVTYTVEGGTDGDYHAVTIPAALFMSDISAERMAETFQGGAHVTERGVIDADTGNVQPRESANNIGPSAVDYAYAVVHIQGGTATGTIDATYLGSRDTGSKADRLALHSAGTDVSDGSLVDPIQTLPDPIDGVDLTVTSRESAQVSLTELTDPYVAGSGLSFQGTASGTVERVAVFASDSATPYWGLVQVGGQNTFQTRAENNTRYFGGSGPVHVGKDQAGAGNKILSRSGTYQVAVVDVTNVQIPDASFTIPDSEFGSKTSAVRSLTVEPGIEDRTNWPRNLEDRTSVTGRTYAGVKEVAVFAVDYEMQNDWQLVQIDDANTIPVQSDGTTGRFETAAVDLSNGSGGGNELLAEPGAFRMAIVDVAGLDAVDASTTLTNAELNQKAHTSEPIKVARSSVSLEQPTAYTMGQEATVSGSTSYGVDEVAIFVHYEGDWRILEVGGKLTLPVDSQQNFEVTGAVLSEGDGVGNEELEADLTFDIGVVDVADLGALDVQSTLTKQAFENATTDSHELPVS